jgi:hypothetical protein
MLSCTFARCALSTTRRMRSIARSPRRKRCERKTRRIFAISLSRRRAPISRRISRSSRVRSRRSTIYSRNDFSLPGGCGAAALRFCRPTPPSSTVASHQNTGYSGAARGKYLAYLLPRATQPTFAAHHRDYVGTLALARLYSSSMLRKTMNAGNFGAIVELASDEPLGPVGLFRWGSTFDGGRLPIGVRHLRSEK